MSSRECEVELAIAATRGLEVDLSVPPSATAVARCVRFAQLQLGKGVDSFWADEIADGYTGGWGDLPRWARMKVNARASSVSAPGIALLLLLSLSACGGRSTPLPDPRIMRDEGSSHAAPPPVRDARDSEPNSPVPEPFGATLVALGVLGLAVRRRRASSR